MINTPLIFAITNDVAGISRGKAFPAKDLDKRLTSGVGWTPTNVMMNCFDVVGDGPFGALGDLLLIPDAETNVTVDFEDGQLPERFILGDITSLEGAPWACCTRSILKLALARLKSVGDVTLLSAFEHEFQIKSDPPEQFGGYAYSRFSETREMGETLMAALDAARIKPDSYMKEFGSRQYEVVVGPDRDVKSADTAVVLRELTRACARRCGEDVTFSPILDPEMVGNGVHIHMSFIGRDGTPATYDKDGIAGMSTLTGSFIAGILKYLDSILAMTAPSAISYLRLTPHRWSAAYNNLGFRDREAAVRICPTSAATPEKQAKQYNFEYRAADASASPYLALAAIIHAGCQGIEENLPTPSVTEEDLSTLSAEALEERGYVRLPATLEAALESFAANKTVCDWFPEGFANVYICHKKSELEYLAGMNDFDRCAKYAEVY